MSTLDQVHPSYAKFLPEWDLVRDVYEGEAKVKAEGVKYLPYTSSMIADGVANENQLGFKAYEAYRLRAVWHDLFKDAIEIYMGLLHQKPAIIELPERMQNIRSSQGETMGQLLGRINLEQLTTGRLGLLNDLPVNVPIGELNPLPYITMYTAENVRNWDINEANSPQVTLQWAILNESGAITSPDNRFQWISETRYRVIMLGAGDGAGGDYRNGLFTGDPVFVDTDLKTPMLRGAPMKYLPFTFVNTKDMLSQPDHAPLIGLARAMISIYRGEADYRQNLFMQGQDTFVTIGDIRRADGVPEDAPLRTGAGAWIRLAQDGDAKYVGVSGDGLSEQRTALQSDQQRSEVRAGQLINARVGDKESGEALKTRVGAQTATLKDIAITGAAALERQLKSAAIWCGAEPNAVKVSPNLDFTNVFMTGQDLSQMMDAKDKGAPISYESIHRFLFERGYTVKTFEQEFEQILAEREKTTVFMNKVLQDQKKKELDNSDPKNKPPATPTKPATK